MYKIVFICPHFVVCRVSFRIADNVFGLAEVGEFKAQMFNLVQMFNRIPNVQFSTSAPILANPC
jgi:hypothetical protein